MHALRNSIQGFFEVNGSLKQFLLFLLAEFWISKRENFLFDWILINLTN
jgi:hypothetical protein